MNRFLLAAAALAAATHAHADEGMWMPQQLPQIAKAMKAAGLKTDPQQLARLTEFPMGAIVMTEGLLGVGILVYAFMRTLREM